MDKITKLLDALILICEEKNKPITMPIALKVLGLENTKANQIHTARLLKAKGLVRKKSNGKVFYIKLKPKDLNVT